MKSSQCCSSKLISGGAAPYLTEATPFPLPRTVRRQPTTNKAFEALRSWQARRLAQPQRRRGAPDLSASPSPATGLVEMPTFVAFGARQVPTPRERLLSATMTTLTA